VRTHPNIYGIPNYSSFSKLGVQNWNRPNNAATGKSVTLYERHPYTAVPAGSPVADTFAVVARKNSAVMALGDGVNWGARAALASRCAVYGAVESLNAALFPSSEEEEEKPSSSPKVTTTQEVFQCLLRSFHAAHRLILREGAHLTTLTAAVILPVWSEPGEKRFETFLQSLSLFICRIAIESHFNLSSIIFHLALYAFLVMKTFISM